jgi:hypothetical protein
VDLQRSIKKTAFVERRAQRLETSHPNQLCTPRL